MEQNKYINFLTSNKKLINLLTKKNNNKIKSKSIFILVAYNIGCRLKYTTPPFNACDHKLGSKKIYSANYRRSFMRNMSMKTYYINRRNIFFSSSILFNFTQVKSTLNGLVLLIFIFLRWYHFRIHTHTKQKKKILCNLLRQK